ncbi:MAG: LysE family translocator [Flavobacterium sp.]|uniref:LysE family translocator n=1 Tax=Flavobacterium sp. TaxID=239 RepID=UPI00121BD48C|nr:LysE family transporter [Flavobacterium sp.]RZJ67934.1 MAG: LysE family translocator [Flavobacterium sp.]
MIEDILAAIPVGFVLSFIIGPVFFVLLETSVVKGFRAALSFDVGVILADIVFIIIAYFSSYRLITAIKDDPALFIFGGLVMLTYGIISLVKNKKPKKNIDPEDPAELAKNNYFTLAIKGFFLNFINVGVLGFWLLLIISVGPKLQLQPSRMFTFFTSVILSYFVVDIFKILLAKQLRRYLNPHNILMIKKGISIILIISGLVLSVQGLFPKERERVNKVIEKFEHQND